MSDSLPDAWRRWNGARPEHTGAPAGTILALPGLDKLGPEFRSTLLSIADQLGMSVDALALIMYSESGLNPKALNPLPAAGLNQLTVGANLPGFTNADSVRNIVNMSAVDQLNQIVLPFYTRFGSKVQDANPGFLYMMNFLPGVANQSVDKVIGVSTAGPNGEQPSDPLLPGKSPLTLGQIYGFNSGFAHGKGYFTIGDVYDHIAGKAKVANGKRITVDGTIIDPDTLSPQEYASIAASAMTSPGAMFPGALFQPDFQTDSSSIVPVFVIAVSSFAILYAAVDSFGKSNEPFSFDRIQRAIRERAFLRTT